MLHFVNYLAGRWQGICRRVAESRRIALENRDRLGKERQAQKIETNSHSQPF
jgi:hypothetical protein